MRQREWHLAVMLNYVVSLVDVCMVWEGPKFFFLTGTGTKNDWSRSCLIIGFSNIVFSSIFVQFFNCWKKHKSELFSQKLVENRIRGLTRIHIIHLRLWQFVDLRLVIWKFNVNNWLDRFVLEKTNWKPYEKWIRKLCNIWFDASSSPVKTAVLYRVSIKSYSKNTHSPYFKSTVTHRNKTDLIFYFIIIILVEVWSNGIEKSSHSFLLKTI
jgi:hypothetical protein